MLSKLDPKSLPQVLVVFYPYYQVHIYQFRKIISM